MPSPSVGKLCARSSVVSTTVGSRKACCIIRGQPLLQQPSRNPDRSQPEDVMPDRAPPIPSVPPASLPLTVVIPTLNEAWQIAEALASLRWADEVIVADGGSPDDPVAIARAHGARAIEVKGPTIEIGRASC